MIKLVIWDLDETLWRGTLADGDDVALFEHRAALIRRLNQHGVVSAICSKNELGAARAKLEEFGLWDEFVFPHIAFTPKGEAIAGIIADMQLRAPNVLFVDDNPVNLEEARFRLPELQLLDIREAESDAVLEAIFTDQPASHNRLTEYRALEQKKQDRRAATATTDEDFLRSCEIRACAPWQMDNLDFVDRIVELINRSNQLNYTGSRVDHDALRHDLIDNALTSICWSIFAWDKYGDHGLVGFVMIDRWEKQFKHFVFSCRAMHMGIESYALSRVRAMFPDMTVPDHWSEKMGFSDADWIEDRPYSDPATRQAVFSSHGLAIAQIPNIRIMCTCQSGGLAHYSKHRDVIDFDVAHGRFALRDFHGDAPADPDFPPFIVHGPGSDYKDVAWAGISKTLDEDIYLQCLQKMGSHLERHGIQALIILPPDLLPSSFYKGGMDQMRTFRLNTLWREAAAIFPSLTVLDTDDICAPEDMVDAVHHRPASLEMLSSLIDVWYEHASGAAEQPLESAA